LAGGSGRQVGQPIKVQPPKMCEGVRGKQRAAVLRTMAIRPLRRLVLSWFGVLAAQLVSPMQNDSEYLLRAILTLTARMAIPEEKTAEIVLAKGSSEKQLEAFNLCDGSRSQATVAKMLKLDGGNFSRTVARWIDQGIMFRLGEGREARLLHIYPVMRAAKKR
jgi:hypothetical protein